MRTCLWFYLLFDLWQATLKCDFIFLACIFVCFCYFNEDETSPSVPCEIFFLSLKCYFGCVSLLKVHLIPILSWVLCFLWKAHVCGLLGAPVLTKSDSAAWWAPYCVWAVMGTPFPWHHILCWRTFLNSPLSNRIKTNFPWFEFYLP